MTAKRKPDACDLLDDDHKEVKKKFEAYKELVGSKAKRSLERKQKLATEICLELKVHTAIEEEVFYPPVRAAIKDNDLLNEAEVEHDGAKDLIAQIEASDPSNEMFDAKVTVLGEYIDHHVKEERTEMFPKARAAKGLDLVALREELMVRKEALMEEMTGVLAR